MIVSGNTWSARVSRRLSYCGTLGYVNVVISGVRCQACSKLQAPVLMREHTCGRLGRSGRAGHIWPGLPAIYSPCSGSRHCWCHDSGHGFLYSPHWIMGNRQRRVSLYTVAFNSFLVAQIFSQPVFPPRGSGQTKSQQIIHPAAPSLCFVLPLPAWSIPSSKCAHEVNARTSVQDYELDFAVEPPYPTASTPTGTPSRLPIPSFNCFAYVKGSSLFGTLSVTLDRGLHPVSIA